MNSRFIYLFKPYLSATYGRIVSFSRPIRLCPFFLCSFIFSNFCMTSTRLFVFSNGVYLLPWQIYLHFLACFSLIFSSITCFLSICLLSQNGVYLLLITDLILFFRMCFGNFFEYHVLFVRFSTRTFLLFFHVLFLLGCFVGFQRTVFVVHFTSGLSFPVNAFLYVFSIYFLSSFLSVILLSDPIFDTRFSTAL